MPLRTAATWGLGRFCLFGNGAKELASARACCPFPRRIRALEHTRCEARATVAVPVRYMHARSWSQPYAPKKSFAVMAVVPLAQ